jgi:hypothetical protein
MYSVQPPQGAKEAKPILPKGQMIIGNLQVAQHWQLEADVERDANKLGPSDPDDPDPLTR